MSIDWLGTGRIFPGWGQAVTGALHCMPCQNTAFGFLFCNQVVSDSFHIDSG